MRIPKSWVCWLLDHRWKLSKTWGLFDYYTCERCGRATVE